MFWDQTIFASLSRIAQWIACNEIIHRRVRWLSPRLYWRGAKSLSLPSYSLCRFCRVLPDLLVSNLRAEIDQQFSDERIVPRDYVFLKNVGRCLTKVSIFARSQHKRLSIHYRNTCRLKFQSSFAPLQQREELVNRLRRVAKYLTPGKFAFSSWRYRCICLSDFFRKLIQREQIVCCQLTQQWSYWVWLKSMSSSASFKVLI